MKFVRAIIALIVINLMCDINFVIALDNVASSTKSDLSAENTLCTKSKCIMKCCPNLKCPDYVFKQNLEEGVPLYKQLEIICVDCMVTTDNFSHFAMEVFSEYPKINYLVLEAGIFEANETVRNVFKNIFWENPRLNADGELCREFPNYYERWERISNDKYCWDYRQDGSGPKPYIWGVPNMKQSDHKPLVIGMAKINVVGMLVSCIFLAMVPIVHWMLIELRNLHGLIIMAFTTSYLCAFLPCAVLYTQAHVRKMCVTLSYLNYYFQLATYCWMNVLSHDVWDTSRYINRLQLPRNTTCKVLLYLSYALGMPLTATMFLAVVNTADMRSTPWFITPKIPDQGCFLQRGERFLYLNVPMIILVTISSVFCFMAAYKWWRINRSSKYNAITKRTFIRLKIRLTMQLKLFAAMGLNCVVEVIGSLHHGYSNAYSDFMGLIIFFIFICRKEILGEIKERLQILRCQDNEENNSLDSGQVALTQQ